MSQAYKIYLERCNSEEIRLLFPLKTKRTKLWRPEEPKKNQEKNNQKKCTKKLGNDWRRLTKKQPKKGGKVWPKKEIGKSEVKRKKNWKK